MRISIEKQDNKFKVITQVFSTDWLPDTPYNRKIVVIMLRYMLDENGNHLFTYQELAVILESEVRQAASKYVEDFRAKGEDFFEALSRKCKVDAQIVEAVSEVLNKEPLFKLKHITEKVNEKLGRDDISEANVLKAWEHINCKEILDILRKKLEKGELKYQENYLLDRLFEIILETQSEEHTIDSLPQGFINQIVQATKPMGETPEEILALNEKKVDVETNIHDDKNPLKEKQEITTNIWNTSLGWQIWAFLLYLQGVSMSSIGNWLGVDKSTICRWLSNVQNWTEGWLENRKVNFSGQVAVDEKWIKIDGVFWYLFAAVDCITGYPLCVKLYPHNDGYYCKLFLLELKKLGYSPLIIITDGWNAYLEAIKLIFPNAQHLYCRFHAIKSLFRRLAKANIFDKKIFKLVCNLFKTSNKKTVKRRLEKIRLLLALIGMERVLKGILGKLPKLLKAVGSVKLPSTANSVERFFGAFERFYRVKGPFCDEASAKKHIDLFLLKHLLTIGQRGQPCLLEKAGGNVKDIPLYHFINRPNVLMLKKRMEEQYQRAS